MNNTSSNILEVTNLPDLKWIISSCMTVVLGFTTKDTPHDRKVEVRKFLKRKSELFPLIKFVYMEVTDEDRQKLNILGGETSDYPKIYHIRGGNNVLMHLFEANEKSMNESFKMIEHIYNDDKKLFQEALKKNMLDNKNEKEDESKNNNDELEVSDGENNNNKTKINNSPNMSTQVKESHLMENTSLSCEGKTIQVPGSRNTERLLPPDLEKKQLIEKLVLLNEKRDSMEIDLLKEVAKRKRLESAIQKQKEIEEKEYRHRKVVRKQNK
jgi:hypothetical protein